MKPNPLIHGLSDEALAGAIAQLGRCYRQEWENRRLRDLQAEQQRRSAKRRGKDLIPSR